MQYSVVPLPAPVLYSNEDKWQVVTLIVSLCSFLYKNYRSLTVPSFPSEVPPYAMAYWHALNLLLL